MQSYTEYAAVEAILGLDVMLKDSLLCSVFCSGTKIDPKAVS